MAFDAAAFASTAFQAVGSPAVGDVPAIGGDAVSGAYAIAGLARAGVVRADYQPSDNRWMKVTIAGVDMTSKIRLHTLEFEDVEGQQADSCRFICEGFRPVPGTVITVDNFTQSERVFGGAIVSATQASRFGSPQPEIWSVTCTDWSYFLDRRRLWGRFVQWYPDALIQYLVATYSRGFTTDGVAAGAPQIYEIEFSGVTLSQAISRITKRSGRSYRISGLRDIKVFEQETEFATAIEPGRYHWWDLNYTRTVTQLRNRVWGEGAGGTTTAFVAAGATALPLDSVAWYTATDPIDKLVSVGGQIFRWTSVNTGTLTLNLDPLTPVQVGIFVGQTANIMVMREDLAAQQERAIIEQGFLEDDDGIHEFVLSDHRLNYDALRSLVEGELKMNRSEVIDGYFKTYDDTFKAGRYVNIILPGRGIRTTVLCHRVTSRARAPKRYIERTVEFTSSHKLEIFDVLRLSQLALGASA
jgi:hypothetical protein